MRQKTRSQKHKYRDTWCFPSTLPKDFCQMPKDFYIYCIALSISIFGTPSSSSPEGPASCLRRCPLDSHSKPPHFWLLGSGLQRIEVELQSEWSAEMVGGSAVHLPCLESWAHLHSQLNQRDRFLISIHTLPLIYSLHVLGERKFASPWNLDSKHALVCALTLFRSSNDWLHHSRISSHNERPTKQDILQTCLALPNQKQAQIFV